MRSSLGHAADIYNYVEVALWPLLGAVLAASAVRRSGSVRRGYLLAAGTLVIFGASDWFEAQNGDEWWHPWWLLAWKAACVVVLLALLAKAYRRRRKIALRSDGLELANNDAQALAPGPR